MAAKSTKIQIGAYWYSVNKWAFAFNGTVGRFCMPIKFLIPSS